MQKWIPYIYLGDHYFRCFKASPMSYLMICINKNCSFPTHTISAGNTTFRAKTKIPACLTARFDQETNFWPKDISTRYGCNFCWVQYTPFSFPVSFLLVGTWTLWWVQQPSWTLLTRKTPSGAWSKNLWASLILSKQGLSCQLWTIDPRLFFLHSSLKPCGFKPLLVWILNFMLLFPILLSIKKTGG